MKKIKAGISVGDINGVGVEVILKSFAKESVMDLCIPIVYAHTDVLYFHMDALGLKNIELNIIHTEEDAVEGKINVFSGWDESVYYDLGKNRPSGGKYALASLQRVSKAIKDKSIDMMITAPLNKNNIEHSGFTGHTGYLSEKFGHEALMIMVSNELKVALVTEHVSVSEVPARITEDAVLHKIKALNASLINDFGIKEPSIAVLGLNPHAGDGGLIGKEEIEFIAPAVKTAKEEGIYVRGPISSDGFFGTRSYEQYDAVLAMYHDQGLIPFKAISFESGVNFTAGLSIVRTSPGHGVAYDLAGQGMASTKGFEGAVILACEIYNRRFNPSEERYSLDELEG